MDAQPLLDRQDTTMCKSVSRKVWETEDSSPRKAMAITQQSAAVVSRSHQLLLVSVVGEGNSRWLRQEPGRNGGTPKFREGGPAQLCPQGSPNTTLQRAIRRESLGRAF